MTGLTENLLNMFLMLGIVAYILDIVCRVSFSAEDEDENGP